MSGRFYIVLLASLAPWGAQAIAMCVFPYERLVVLMPLSCKKLSDHRDEVLSRWKQKLPPKEIENIERMLDHNQGIILHVKVLRERELWWQEAGGKGFYRAGEWKELNETRDYYYQTSKQNACAKFESEEAINLYSDSSCCDTIPPQSIDCLLEMKALWKPPKSLREFFQASGK